MKPFLLTSILAVSTLMVMAQPPDLTDAPEKSAVQTDTTYAEGTHTTARERRGLPADSTKKTSSKTSVKTKHTHTEAHKTQKRTSASSK